MMAKQKGQPAQSAFYQDSLAHLVDELRKLDSAHPATHCGPPSAATGCAGHDGLQRSLYHA